MPSKLFFLKMLFCNDFFHATSAKKSLPHQQKRDFADVTKIPTTSGKKSIEGRKKLPTL
jgi:coenzyme F420-reducing hydrogenase beta subunit